MVVQVGTEDQGLLTAVIPVTVVLPLVVQLTGLKEKVQREKKVWLEMIKLDLEFDHTQCLMMKVRTRAERILIRL